jgi:hypothetical protein
MSNSYGRQVVIPLTNKSGGGVIAGDVVVVDTTNNDAFTTSTAGAVTLGVGIAQETIASNAVGRVLIGGYAALVNVNASVTRGHVGKTHTVAKQATDAGASRTVGTFCIFLTGGTTPDAWVYPADLNASSGNVATDPIWDAAGDLAVGTGADTAAKLAIGNAGAVLARINGAVAWNASTAMPTATTADRYFRTDKGLEFYYDGTRWVSTTLFIAQFVAPTALMALTATGGAGSYNMALNTGTDIWLVDCVTQMFVASGGTALGASHNWVGIITKSDTSNVGTTLITVTLNSGASAAWRTDTQAIGALLGTAATYPRISASWTKTGTPGNLTAIHTVTYRIVQT